MSREITEEMLFNYFDNKATTLEKKQIDEWVKTPENAELFYQSLALWESRNLQYVSDVESAIGRHQNRLQTIRQITPENDADTNPRKGSSLKWLVAASLLVGVVLGGYFSKDRILYKTLATSYGQTKSILLDDGTKVVLNSNSALTVPRFGFGDYTRKVSLKGEADFSVTHLPNDQKFMVKTLDGADVVVLGTEFTVYTRVHGTKVVLSKGKIQLNYNENKKSKNLIMHPGELVTIDEKGKAVMKKTANPEVFSAWKDHRYVFDHTSLKDLCTLFEENFGLKIEMTDREISTWTLSGAFNASDAEELLEALSESSGLVYKKEDQKVIILSLRNSSNQ